MVSKSQDDSGEQAGGAWSEEEDRLLVQDYFEMLQADLRGHNYNKAEHNRQLREKLQSRSRASIEFKHQNVSAVLFQMGLPIIDGYKPARNYQRALLASVQEHLDSNPTFFTSLAQVAERLPDQLPHVDAWQRCFEAPPDEMQAPEAPPEPWRFREGRKIDYVQREAANRQLGRMGEPCPFCAPDAQRVWLERDAGIALWDAFPVTEGHTLIVPRQHVASIYELPEDIQAGLWALVAECRQRLALNLKPDGFNIGLNDGTAAGQTIPHAHIHVIPRRSGDVADPRGGVRYIIPHRAQYW
ncbi:MAG: HIT family protein [Planctomycetota bacterium]